MMRVPHERSLVQRLEGKPFVFLGVNLDTSKEEQKKAEAKNRITWRSWFDGWDGPICKTWRLTAPTIYILDHHGVIRYKNLHGEDLDKAVDKLMEEMTSHRP